MGDKNENEVKKEYLNKFRENREAVQRIEEQISEFELYETTPKTIGLDNRHHGTRVKKD